MDRQVTALETDILVIGAGFAGMWAALRAAQLGARVILVDKGKTGRSGCSTLASGVQLCPQPGDDLESWKQEIVERGEYFPDQDWLDVFFPNQIDRIADYDRWGVPLEKDAAGKIIRVATRGHVNTRVFMFHGRKLMDVLSQQVERAGVRVIDRLMLCDLLTADGQLPTGGTVVGAVGFNTRTAAVYTINAGAVVQATGGIRPLKANRVGTVTGDGQAMAWRAGAGLTNLEFCTSGNINCWERKGYAGGINMLQGNGARIVNRLGERFMPRYDPVLEERAILCRLFLAYAKEVIEGRGPIYIDTRAIPAATVERFRRVIPHPMKLFDRLGIEVGKDLIENSPAVEAPGCPSGEGGIKVDLQGSTGIPGLFAAGAVTRNPIRGIIAVGGLSTASCNVLGYVAGENAARWALGQPRPGIVRQQVADFQQEQQQIMDRSGRLDANQLRLRLLECTAPVQVSLVKHQQRITQTIAALEQLQAQLIEVQAPDTHELVKVYELQNLFVLGDLVFRSALERQESRSWHYREEFPYTDNLEWLKFIVWRRRGKATTITYEPVIAPHYSYQPVREKQLYPVQVFWKSS